MDYSDFDIYLARLVRRNFAAANYNTPPASTEDWHEVARRLGVTHRMDAEFRGGALLLDDLLIHGKGTDKQVEDWTAHELAENRLRCECEAPFVLQGDEDHYHRIARLVETLLDEPP